MIYVGIDDTDVVDSPGTNQLARGLARRVAGQFHCHRITRHQLFVDPRVPYTSKNGSASLVFENKGDFFLSSLIAELRAGMKEWYLAGSDPGLAVATQVSHRIHEFGLRCQRELVSRAQAEGEAKRAGIFLEGLGGTGGGMIGALAAVGLADLANDGRIVQIGSWEEDLSGVQEIDTITARGIEIRELETHRPITRGHIDVGKHLRPNMREGKVILFVQRPAAESAEPESDIWQAVRLL